MELKHTRVMKKTSAIIKTYWPNVLQIPTKALLISPYLFFFCIAPPAFNKRSDNLSGFRGGPHFIWWTTFLVSFLWWIKTWWISSAELRNYSEVIKTLFSEHTNFRFCQLYRNKFSVANQPKWKSFVITHQA